MPTTSSDDDLLTTARAARDRSYAPYSDFHMGAAVRCADGTIVPGALVENVSLGLAMCAERAALFATVAQDLAPTELVLVSKRTEGDLTFPCGACLQVALELRRTRLPRDRRRSRRRDRDRTAGGSRPSRPPPPHVQARDHAVKRDGLRNSMTWAVAPVVARSARISPITGANL